MKSVLKHSRNQARRELRAQQAAEGDKPWGKPWEQTFGSAYFMLPEQIIAAGIGLTPEVFGERSVNAPFLTLGMTTFKDTLTINVLDRDGHALTIAPTRSGKGVGAVIPNLLLYGGSMVVNDIKGENYAVTARFRRSMGQHVLKFAPFDEDTDFWNPFDLIDDGDDAWEDVRTFAELLIPERGEQEGFWNSEARNLLAGVILHMHTTLPEEERTMWHLRHLLTEEEDGLEVLLLTMASSEHVLVHRVARSFLRADEKVRAGVMTTLNSHMGIWDSPRLKHMMSQNSYRLPMMQHFPVTVYFSIPPSKLETYAPVVRLFMGMLIKNLSSYGRRGECSVLFLLDEFPALGRMKIVEEGMTYLAGYGVNFWLFAQDLKQLVATYGEKAESIIANCAVKQFFGVADYDTAKLVSHMCGETTVPSISYSSEAGLDIKNPNYTVGSGARPLLTPNEIMNLPKDAQLLFFQGQQVVAAGKINYLTNPYFLYQGVPIFDPNPFHS
jgi:type IV secretion system protein VirD4